jgi:hypothetical protein
MKTSKLSLALAALFFTTAMTITSCKKKTVETKDVDNDTTETSDQSMAENASNDIVNIGSQATDNTSGSLSTGKTLSSENALAFCATIKRDTIHHIDSVIFDNSTCLDGRSRNGVLIFNYSASDAGAKHYRDPGFKCSVTSYNYTVDGKAINVISKTIENVTAAGFNPATTNLTWNITGHIQIVKTNGTHDFSYVRVKTLLNTADATVYHGQPTPISWGLAKIGLTGNGSGTTVNGRPYTCNVTNQLVRDFGGCTILSRHPFIQGTLDFTPGTKATRILDFGTGTCDLNASVTINNITYNIVLP